MEPILTCSEITGRVYIVTKHKRLDGGVIDAREKFDVTEWAESYARKRNAQTVEENAKLREVIDDITEVVEDSDPALVQFIAKRMERAGIEVES